MRCSSVSPSDRSSRRALANAARKYRPQARCLSVFSISTAAARYDAPQSSLPRRAQASRSSRTYEFAGGPQSHQLPRVWAHWQPAAHTTWAVTNAQLAHGNVAATGRGGFERQGPRFRPTSIQRVASISNLRRDGIYPKVVPKEWTILLIRHSGTPTRTAAAASSTTRVAVT